MNGERKTERDPRALAVNPVVRTVYFITHPDVVIDPSVAVRDWPLSQRGRDRMARALCLPWMNDVCIIWCSAERKARDGAEILAEQRGLPVHVLEALGENDRSATGYLPSAEFEAVANLFFARPHTSVRGWERAVDAQRRIVEAIDQVIVNSSTSACDVAIVSHGGVGALLLCHLQGYAVSRTHDQPPNNGGNYFSFDVHTRRVLHEWQPIDGV